MSPIIAAAAGLLLGGGAGYFLFLRVLTGKADSIVREAELKDESIKEKKILQAKEKFIQLKEKQADQRKDLERKLNERQERIKRRVTSSVPSTRTRTPSANSIKIKKSSPNDWGRWRRSSKISKPTIPRPLKLWKNSAA